MKSLLSRLSEAWCRFTHAAPMWPIHGQYRCPTCFRSYAVAWGEETPRRSAPVLSWLEPALRRERRVC